MDITIYTEDSSKHSNKILQNILNKTFFLLKTTCNIEDIEYEEYFSEEILDYLSGNQWKDEERTNELATLCRTLATRICSETSDFIFWHIDSDVVWNDEITENSEHCSLNLKQFENIIVKKTLDIISGIDKSKTKKDFYNKVILLVPYYSIESWLYFFHNKINNEEVCLEVKKMFTNNPGKHYDEILAIKDEVKFGSTFNHDFSQKFSGQKLHAEEKSYAFFLEQLKENKLLIESIPSR